MSDPIVPLAERNPLKSPSYPQRVHIGEKAHWQSILAHWDMKISLVQKRGIPGADAARTFGQMAGARDQIAEAVKRLPMEVGEMYEEDKHRLEEGVAALERLMAKV